MARQFPAQLVLFLVVFAWQVQVAVDPRSLAFVHGELFLWNLRFFRDFLLAPGDLTQWLARAALEACHLGWPGTLILTAVACLILIPTREFFKILWPSQGGGAWMVSALVLIAIHGRYEYPISTSLGAAIAMIATVAYVGFVERCVRWRIVVFAGLSALVYYVGGAAFYVFVACAMIYELYRPGHWGVKVGCVLGAITGRFLIDAALNAFRPNWFFLHVPITTSFAAERSLDRLTFAMHASFPLIAALVADRAARRRQGTPAALGSNENRPGAAEEGFKAWLRRTALTAGFVALAAFAGWATARPEVQTVLALHASADREEWDQVLRLGRRVAPQWYSQHVVHDVNMALYHVGRLPYDLFAYRQFASPVVVATHPGPNALLFLDLDAFALRKLGDFHFHLGRLNDAEYYVHESFVRRPSAECLRLLTRIALAKDEVDQARTFLNVLRDDWVFGAWAEDWLRRLQGAADVPADAEIDAVRRLRLVEEDIHHTAEFVANPIIAGRKVSTRKQIVSALAQNPHHRMAFEFLMAWYLIDARVTEAVALLPLAANFSYPAIPPLYEEAAMIHARVYERRKMADGPMQVYGCAISEDTLRKIRQLDAALGSKKADDKETARIAKELGLSYFDFYYYGRWGE